MDTKILITLLSISASALIGSLSYFFHNRLNSKKKLRAVLYHLLQLRHAIQVTLINPQKMTDDYIKFSTEKLNKLGIPIEKEVLEANIQDGIYEYFNNISIALKTDIKVQILPPLENSLLELGSIDPVLAFSLRGKEKIEEVINHTTSYSESVVEPEITKLQKEFSGSIFSDTTKKHKNIAIKEIMEVIDDDILYLSKRCGLFDHIKCKGLLKKSIPLESHNDFSDMDSLLEEFMSNLMSEISKGNTVNENTESTE